MIGRALAAFLVAALLASPAAAASHSSLFKPWINGVSADEPQMQVQRQMLGKDRTMQGGNQILKFEYRILVSSYKADKVNPMRVVDMWLQLMRMQLELARLEASLGQTLASLERVVGEQLTRLKETSASANCPAPGGASLGQPMPGPPPGDVPATPRPEILPPPRQPRVIP